MVEMERAPVGGKGMGPVSLFCNEFFCTFLSTGCCSSFGGMLFMEFAFASHAKNAHERRGAFNI